jgi:hypothetical protein
MGLWLLRNAMWGGSGGWNWFCAKTPWTRLWVEIHVHSLPIAGEEKEGNALGSFKSPSRYKRIQVRLWITAQQEKLWIECTILQLLLQTNNWHQTLVNLHHPSEFSCVWNVVWFAHAGLVMCFCSCLQLPKVGTRASSQEPDNSNRSNLECPTADQ